MLDEENTAGPRASEDELQPSSRFVGFSYGLFRFFLVPAAVKTFSGLTWRHLVKSVQIECPPDPQSEDSSRKSSVAKSRVSLLPLELHSLKDYPAIFQD